MFFISHRRLLDDSWPSFPCPKPSKVPFIVDPPRSRGVTLAMAQMDGESTTDHFMIPMSEGPKILAHSHVATCWEAEKIGSRLCQRVAARQRLSKPCQHSRPVAEPGSYVDLALIVRYCKDLWAFLFISFNLHNIYFIMFITVEVSLLANLPVVLQEMAEQNQRVYRLDPLQKSRCHRKLPAELGFLTCPQTKKGITQRWNAMDWRGGASFRGHGMGWFTEYPLLRPSTTVASGSPICTTSVAGWIVIAVIADNQLILPVSICTFCFCGWPVIVPTHVVLW